MLKSYNTIKIAVAAGSLHIVVMTKFPELGKVKTRLIPHLGNSGAYKLHKVLAERLINDIIDPLSHVTLCLHVSGGDDDEVSQWLEGRPYTRQVEGDLGVKIKHAVDLSFQQGANKVIVLGTDCPSINEALINKVVASLDHYDLVYTPANDGGYVLVGLSKPCDNVFENIDWGTDLVMQQSVASAVEASCSLLLLQPLNDVDVAEDLAHAVEILGYEPWA